MKWVLQRVQGQMDVKFKMKAEMWSKNNCFFCSEEKNLLIENKIEFNEKNLDEEYTKQQLLEILPNAKTVPQIFLDGKYIGGFIELQNHLFDK